MNGLLFSVYIYILDIFPRNAFLRKVCLEIICQMLLYFEYALHGCIYIYECGDVEAQVSSGKLCLVV